MPAIDKGESRPVVVMIEGVESSVIDLASDSSIVYVESCSVCPMDERAPVDGTLFRAVWVERAVGRYQFLGPHANANAKIGAREVIGNIVCFDMLIHRYGDEVSGNGFLDLDVPAYATVGVCYNVTRWSEWRR